MPVLANSAAARPQEAAVREPDDIALEQERERFLGEFKAMVYESDGQIDGQIDGAISASVAVGASVAKCLLQQDEPALELFVGCGQRRQEPDDVPVETAREKQQ